MNTLTPEREACFRALYADTYGDVLRFVQRRVHPSHAEDVAADAFLVAWRRLDDAPRRSGDRRAWLFGIARNCLLNTRRGQERQSALAVRIAESAPPSSLAGTPDSDLVTARLDLASGWRRLSESDQEALALSVFEELTSPQAAQVLGITAAAYRLRLMRARRALRREVEVAGSPLSVHVQMETQS